MWALFSSHYLLTWFTLRHEDWGGVFLRNISEVLLYCTPLYPQKGGSFPGTLSTNISEVSRGYLQNLQSNTGRSALKQTTLSLRKACLPHSSQSLHLYPVGEFQNSVTRPLFISCEVTCFVRLQHIVPPCSPCQKHDLVCVSLLSGRRRFAGQSAWLSGRRQTRRFVQRCQSTPSARVKLCILLGNQMWSDWTLINNTYGNWFSVIL
jgi:hypothetical protein